MFDTERHGYDGASSEPSELNTRNNRRICFCMPLKKYLSAWNWSQLEIHVARNLIIPCLTQKYKVMTERAQNQVN